ncbi:transcriptional regulator [Granulicatella sp. zg-ZJ]|uniref:winged helix-turn-helix transcriptional regulator n=1 Tax=unclassified Granulicatella TaxID=2630493 RepID=UPI0013C0FC59|nr:MULTISPECIES: helix-turn-helix domain-containing protein [unclassified Granulicatella]MBS4750085.1 helix-turn-helix transcriptional regulator [Carnobacteriaceae bacterium zg-ZUI78]NEW63115.1 transcriptional regulator [Granulicatella sp. zg-ZJ]NEW66616.1 transcriptional regulator [Granulicatella sp. zg-84]QMI86267.1 helix-turn-helix transcriptional regulator [Carnobacteriaceae bacterium zg-84]
MKDLFEFELAQVKPSVVICPKYEQTFRILGKRWNAMIIEVLRQGECRFSQLSRAIEGLSDRVLTERLREMEQEDLIEKNTECPEHVKFTYRLTQKGLELAQATQSLKEWAQKWITEDCQEEKNSIE